jgi:hypothetical protein
MRRYLLGLLLVAGLLILLIVLIAHGGSKTKTPSTAVIPKALHSYSDTNATVSMEIDGPVNANSAHNQLLVTIGSTNATIEALQGYNGSVIRSSTYANTQAAYNVFLYALQYAGFTEGNPANSLSNETGYCPTGNRYIFEIQQNGTTLQRYWTTDCGTSTPHSFEGNFGLVNTLFQQQIPNYQSFSQNLNLNG